MIKHGLVPDIEHSVSFEGLPESVRPESAKPDGKKTKCSCNPKKQKRRHH
jgi:hypothetical protein